MIFISVPSLTSEQKALLKDAFERMTAMKPLTILEKKIPEKERFLTKIKPEYLQVDTGMAKHNSLILYIHDDDWYTARKVPVGGSKVLGYNIFRGPMGLISVEVFAGERVRGEDLRSLRYLNKNQKKFDFVYREDTEYYQEFDKIDDTKKLSPNQQIALERQEYVDELSIQLLSFVEDFEHFLRTEFISSPSVMNDPVRIQKNVEMYAKLYHSLHDFILIQFIFGRIEEFERVILLKYLRALERMIDYLKSEWKSMSENALWEFYNTKLSPFAEKMIKQRKYDISAELGKLKTGNVTRKSAESLLDVIRGYLLDDKTPNFAPSMLEISRRVDLYEEFAKQASEDQFLRLLKESLNR